jgi:hypothetical protein
VATPIPAFVAQWLPLSSSIINDDQGIGGQIATTRWYYFVSNRTTASNGQSLLKAIKDTLDASSVSNGSITWTVVLTSTYKVKITSSSGSTQAIDMSTDMATALGFISTGPVSVPTSTGVTADYISPLLWSPDMPISMTGPLQFDPSLNYGVPSSAGNVQRAPDMTAAAVSNGIQWSAEYRFNGVSPYYKVRKIATASGHVNEDLETFWSTSLALGRRVLLWRDRLNLVGSNAPSEGTASPYNYVEYFPQPQLREQLPGTPMTPYVLTHWDVSLPLFVTENGETPLSD